MKKLTPLMLNLSSFLFGKENALNKQIQDLCGFNTNIVDSLNSLSFKILQSQLNDYTNEQRNSVQNLIFSPLHVLLMISILNYGLGVSNTKAHSDLLGNFSFYLIKSFKFKKKNTLFLKGNSNLNSHRNNLHQLAGSLLKNLTKSINEITETEFDFLTILQFAKYLELSYPIEDELTSNYNVQVNRYDFFNEHDYNRALNDSYRLIRQHTKNQLNQFSLQYLPKDASRLNIYSTLHLQSNWLDAFNSIHTYSDRFYNHNGKLTNILYMSRNTYVNVHTLVNRDLQLIELPLEDNQLSMIIIYSSQRYALSEMLFSTKNDELNNAIKNLTRKYINIRIPRFTVDRQLTIQQLLKPLKINLDCKHSSLARFSKHNRTCLDFNLFYTKLKIDEQGLNAINQETGFYGQQKIDTIAPKLFVQSPFAFIIRDRSTGVFIFLGLINHF